MTHDHIDTPHVILTLFVVPAGQSEFIDFDLKNRNSDLLDLLACFSVLICDFSQSIKIPL